MTRRTWMLLAAAPLALLPPAGAAAQSPAGADAPADAPPDAPPEPNPSGLDEIAQKHYDDGRAAASRGDWQTAYTSFRAGYGLQNHPLIVGALGLASAKLGKHREAAEYLTLYLQSAPAGATAAERAEAQKALAEAKKQVGTLTLTAPAGADVFIDKVLVGKAPLGREAFAEPGKRQIEASLGDDLARQIVTVEMGKTATVNLVFGQPLPPPILTAAPAPTAPPPLPTTAPTQAPRDEGPRRELVIIGASVAAGAAVAGAALLGASRVKAGDEERLRGELVGLDQGNVCNQPAYEAQCRAIRDAGGTADALTNSGAWLLIGAGAVGAATAIYYFVAKKPAPAHGQAQPPRSAAPGARGNGPTGFGASAFAGPGQGGGTFSFRW